MDSAKLWETLTKAVSLAEINDALVNRSKTHSPIQAAWRVALELKEFVPEMVYIRPTPEWIGEALQIFLQYYSKAHPELFKESEKEPEKEPEQEQQSHDELFEDDEPKKTRRQRGNAQPRNAIVEI